MQRYEGEVPVEGFVDVEPFDMSASNFRQLRRRRPVPGIGINKSQSLELGLLRLLLLFVWVYTCQQANNKRIFLPRDAMHKRGLCRHAVSDRPSVRLSVCMSVTFVDHVKTNKHIFEIFRSRVATPFWFFHTKLGGDTPTRTPLTGASNARGYDKMTHKYLALSQKRLYLDGHMQRDNL